MLILLTKYSKINDFVNFKSPENSKLTLIKPLDTIIEIWKTSEIG